MSVMPASEPFVYCPNIGMEKLAMGLIRAFGAGMRGASPLRAGLGGLKPTGLASKAMQLGGSTAKNFGSQGMYGLKPLAKGLSTVAPYAGVGYLGYKGGHTKGMLEGGVEGSAQVLNHFQQHPWQGAGYSLASLFGQGNNALQHGFQAKMEQSGSDPMWRMILPMIMQRVKQLQPPAQPQQ